MMNPISRTAFTFVLVIGLAACGQSKTDPEQGREAERRDNSNSDPAKTRSDMGMHEAMASALGADVSDTWVRKMIAHHEGAIAMTEAVVAEGGDPRVVAMARRMGAKQQREIGEMRRLIRAGSAPDPASARPYAAGEKRMHDAMMAARGADASQSFLHRMIPHHQGAIDMSRVVLDRGGDERVAAIARRIIADQSREIAEIQALLSGKSDPRSIPKR